jgi:hypothetical protein
MRRLLYMGAVSSSHYVFWMSHNYLKASWHSSLHCKAVCEFWYFYCWSNCCPKERYPASATYSTHTVIASRAYWNTLSDFVVQLFIWGIDILHFQVSYTVSWYVGYSSLLAFLPLGYYYCWLLFLLLSLLLATRPAGYYSYGFSSFWLQVLLLFFLLANVPWLFLLLFTFPVVF